MREKKVMQHNIRCVEYSFLSYPCCAAQTREEREGAVEFTIDTRLSVAELKEQLLQLFSDDSSVNLTLSLTSLIFCLPAFFLYLLELESRNHESVNCPTCVCVCVCVL